MENKVTYTNFGDALAQSYEERKRRAATNPSLIKALAKYESNLDCLEKELEYKLNNAQNKGFNWDEEAIKDLHKIKVDNYKKKFKEYLNDYLSYITDYLSTEQKKEINKKYSYRFFDI